MSLKNDSAWEKEEFYAIAIFPYHVERKFHLRLDMGDIVRVEAQAKGWFKGFRHLNGKTKNTRVRKGVFPAAFVAVWDSGEPPMSIVEFRKQQQQQQQQKQNQHSIHDEPGSDISNTTEQHLKNRNQNNNNNNNDNNNKDDNNDYDEKESRVQNKNRDHDSKEKSSNVSPAQQKILAEANIANIFGSTSDPFADEVLIAIQEWSVKIRQYIKENKTSQVEQIRTIISDLLKYRNQYLKTLLSNETFQQQEEQESTENEKTPSDDDIYYDNNNPDMMNPSDFTFNSSLNNESNNNNNNNSNSNSNSNSNNNNNKNNNNNSNNDFYSNFEKITSRQKRLEYIRKTLVRTIDTGYDQLLMPSTIRVSSNGERANEENSGVTEVYHRYRNRALHQEEASLRKREVDMQEMLAQHRLRRVASEQDRFNLEDDVYQLTLNIPDLFIDTYGDQVTATFALYSIRQSRIISEEFAIQLDMNGRLTHGSRFPQKSVFKDIEGRDIEQGVMLLVRLYRRGTMFSKKSSNLNVREHQRENHTSENNHENSSKKKSHKKELIVDRPFGFSGIVLTPIVVEEMLTGNGYQLVSNSDSSTSNNQNGLEIFEATKEEVFSSIHELLASGDYLQHNHIRRKSSESARISLNLGLHLGSLSNVRSEQHHLNDAVVAEMLKFPRLISPDDRRNDLYVTLYKGEFDKKNIQVKMCIRVGDNVGLEKCISRYRRHTLVPESMEHRSTVFYHVPSPAWHEVVRVRLPPEDLERATVIFTFYHANTKKATLQPEGFAFLRLHDGSGTLMPDSRLSAEVLNVYRYQDGVETMKSWDDYVANSKNLTKHKFAVQIKLVSTMVTQYPEINKLLKWKQIRQKSSLKDILSQFSHFPTAELRKFLREILDALFTILEEHNNERTAFLVFTALVNIIVTFVDTAHTSAAGQHSAPLTRYIDTLFESPSAHRWLVHCLLYYLANPEEQLTFLPQIAKTLNLLFKFIAKSRQQYEESLNSKIENNSSTNNSNNNNSNNNNDLETETETDTYSMSMSPAPNSSSSSSSNNNNNNNNSNNNSNQMEFDQDESSPSPKQTPPPPSSSPPPSTPNDAPDDVMNDDMFSQRVVSILSSIPQILGSDLPQMIPIRTHLLRSGLSYLFESAAEIVPDQFRLGRCIQGVLVSSHHIYPEYLIPLSHIVSGVGMKQTGCRAVILRDVIIEMRTLIRNLPSSLQEILDRNNSINSPYNAANILLGLLLALETGDDRGRERAFCEMMRLVPEMVTTMQTLEEEAQAAAQDMIRTRQESQRREREVKRDERDVTADSVMRYEASFKELLTKEKIYHAYRHTLRDLHTSLITLFHHANHSVCHKFLSRYPRDRQHVVLNSWIDSVVYILKDKSNNNSNSNSNNFDQNSSSSSSSFDSSTIIPMKWIPSVGFQIRSTFSFILNIVQYLIHHYLPPSSKSINSHQNIDNNNNNNNENNENNEKENEDDEIQILVTPEEIFDAQLWLNIFNAIMDYIQSPCLQLDRISDETIQNMIRNSTFGDLRMNAVQFLMDLWRFLDEQQQFLMTDLVDPVLRLLRVNEWNVRMTAIGMAESILSRDYETFGSLERSEAAFCAALVRFIGEGILTEELKNNLLRGLSSALKQNELGSVGQEFMDTLLRMISSVQDAHDLPNQEEVEKGFAISHVMHYLRRLSDKTLYFNYLHRLEKMHLELGNHVQAAECIIRLSHPLSFASQQRIDPPSSSSASNSMTSAERKLQLFEQAIENLDKGKDWEKAIQLQQELIKYYRSIAFDYASISSVLRSQAGFFSKILHTRRLPAVFYHVSFYGGALPPYLRGKAFIYQGGEGERLDGFKDRLRKRFTDARIEVDPNKRLPDDADAPESQYITVKTVSPASEEDMEMKPLKLERYKPKPVVEYEMGRDVRIFSLSRRYMNGEVKDGNDVAVMYTDIQFFITRDCFPNIYRDIEIVETQLVTRTPLQNAILDIEEKIRAFHDIIKGTDRGEEVDFNQLSMLLTGVIDAAVNGGVSKYIDGFFSEEFIHNNPDQLDDLRRFQQALRDQLVILQQSLVCRRAAAKGASAGLSDHLEERFSKMEKQLREPLARKI